MASHTVHASAKSIAYSLGIIKPSNILLAGPSNAGLADPGQREAISLVQLTATFFNHKMEWKRTIAEMVRTNASLMAAMAFLDECRHAWADADTELNADEKKRESETAAT